MEKYYIHNIILISSFIIFSFKMMYAQMPVISAVEPVATTIEQYEKFEVKLNLTALYNNPYDYEEIAVSAVFTGPNNENVIVDGFFMQDFTIASMQTGNISATNNGVFKIRFSPNQVGEWRYIVYCKTASGTATFAEQIFLCVASSNPINKGFVRTSESNYLQFDNEEQYIPIGENMAWQNGNPIVDYDKWLTKLSENKGNFFRLWQAHWGLGIEWRNGTSGFQGLRKYKQTSAFYQDWLFDFCAEKGIYIMLCIQHHGQVSSNVNPNWSESPYNTANGGPCANTWDFFVNPAAKNFTKNRLRYIIARWGYARSIMSWELFNEVDWTDQFMQHRNDVANWHAEMASYIKEIDPYQHLVSTSYAQDYYDPVVWHNPDIDFTQTHYYINIPNVERTLSAGIKKYLNEYNKPTHNGEFGLGGSASGLSALDPDGIHIHNSLWAALFSGSMGSAMSWWWDNYIEPQNLYYHFAPLAEITNEIKFKEDYYTPITSKVNGAPADLSLNPIQGWGALADTLLTIGEGGAVTPADASLSFFLYGSQWNTQLRRPPVFIVNYPAAGKFIVKTADIIGTSPKIAIWLDGNLILESNAQVNKTYTINVPAGAHRIKVDNTGTDWISIASYNFTGLGSAMDAYVLASADKNKVTGWILNNNYNHDFIKNNGQPLAVSSAVLTVEGLQDAVYQAKWYDCLTGAVSATESVNINNGKLNLLIPNTLWDAAFVLEGQTVGIARTKQAFPFKIYPNPTTTGQINLSFELKDHSDVHISLLDAAGREVQDWFKNQLHSGEQVIQANISNNLAAGIYWVKIIAGQHIATQPLVIVRP